MFSTDRRPPRVLVLTGIAALLVGIASCSSSDTDWDDRSAITWYAGSIDQYKNNFGQILVNDFENAYPSIKVKVVYGPTSTDVKRRELTEMLHNNNNNAPDVYLGDVIWPAEFAHAGLALDLTSTFEPDFWNRFAHDLLPAATYEGRIYAAPFFVDQGMLFYRKDLVIKPPTTWEQLVESSSRLLAERRIEYGYVWQGAPYEGLTCNWVEILADAGGSTLNSSGTTSLINSPNAVRALRFLSDLVTKGITPKEVVGMQEPNSTDLFMTGRAAYLRGWNNLTSTLADTAMHGKVGVAPLPTFADQPGPGHSAIGGWSLFVNPKTKKLDAVKIFMRWMTDVDAQRILVRRSKIPTNAQVRGEQVPDVAVQVGLNVNPVARPSSTWLYPDVSRVVYTSVNAVLNGSKSPEDALREADHELNGIL
jgi:trehalose/maltose transport system substrate-binding protein